jgi:hypothetical protein
MKSWETSLAASLRVDRKLALCNVLLEISRQGATNQVRRTGMSYGNA